MTYADFHDQLILLLPDQNDLLDVGWKMGEIKALKEIQTPYSDAHPNVLVRQYGIVGGNDTKSSLKVTMNVYEFDSPIEANYTNIRYASTILANNSTQIPVHTLGNRDCYAFVHHAGLADEQSTISCNTENFLITSTAEQNGGQVFLKGSAIPTNIAAEGFVKFSLTRVSIMEKALPNWIKNNASWWSQNKISDEDFALGLEYMINNDIIKVPESQTIGPHETKIPSWVKNNAGWWSQNILSDDEFLNSIQYLVKSRIIKIHLKT